MFNQSQSPRGRPWTTMGTFPNRNVGAIMGLGLLTTRPILPSPFEAGSEGWGAVRLGVEERSKK